MADRGIVLDRFEVVRELGLGGAGELLLVRDRKRDGERCALKILRPRSRDPALGPLFRHEFILLSEIRHDSIVGVRDFGVLETGEPFFTMDYVPGENCRAYVRESRLETGEYLDLAAHLLAALGHIHSRGILHRDLKPDNVIMQRRGGRLAPVLVDFGLSVVAGSARPGEATGTMPYIAPEVLAGGRPDARADLYALGVLLFEVATGTSIGPPEDLLRAPNTVLAPSRIRKMMRAAARPTVPAKLERFVSHLMAPTPAARYPSAGAALAALTSLYGDAVAPVRLEASAPSFDPESPLVGRSHPLDALLQRVTALKENVLLDSIVVVGGAAGAGVTRFLTTVRNHAAAGGCMVCVGSTLHELVTEVATHPSFRGTPPAPNEDPTALVFRADAQLVVPPDGVWPILILDDVHTLDERECRALRQWIEALERRTERPRMLLILGGRTDEEGDGSKLLQEVGRAVPMEVRALPPLSVDDIKQALTVILGGTRPPTSVTQALHRASGGNPRLFNELLGVLAAHRVLVVEEGVAALDHDRLKRTKLPRGVADAARLRTECLREASKDLLFRFALIDAPLPVEAARSVSNGELAELLAQRFLILDRGRVRFPDELARRTADLLEGDARSSSLTQLAGAFEKGAPAISARLWAEAGQSDRARFIGLPAAKELRAGGASEEAARLLSKLVGGSPDVEMAYLYGQCLQDLGRSRDIVRMCEPLLQSRTSAKESHDLLLLVTTAIVRLGERERALELLERFDRGTAGERVATLLNAKAGLLYALGRYDEALLESDRAEAAAESVLALQGRLARVRATILRHQGRMKAAMRMEDLLIDAVAADIQPEALIAAHTNRAGYHRVMGRPREGIRDLRRASYLGAELVRPIARARALYSLRFLRSMGRAKTALRVVETARRIFEQAAWVNEVCECLIEEAVCLVDLGNPLEAERRLSRAESLPTASPSPEVRLNEALVRSRLSFLSGHVQAATKTLRSALEDALGHGISKIAVAVEIAECTSDEAAWRDALRVAWTERRADFLPWIRVGLSECAARRGEWSRAERLLESSSPVLTWNTPLRARALLVRCGAALERADAQAGRALLQDSVDAINGCDDVAWLARIYERAAELLANKGIQRAVGKPTAAKSASLLGTARDVWALFGNEVMLQKIDLSLSDLPHGVADNPEADQLVKILHIVREMNREFDRDRLLGLILDRAIEITDAERGFIILKREGEDEIHLARNLDRERVSEPDAKVSSHIVKQVMSTGRVIVSENAETDARFEDFFSVRSLRLRSIIAVPFRSQGRTVGALYLDNRFRPGNFSKREEHLLELFADQAVAAIEKAELIAALETKSAENEGLARRLKDRMRKQGRELSEAKNEIRDHRKVRGLGFDGIVTRSPAMKALVRDARRFAASEIPVLVTGDNGTGKEKLARAIHYASPRQSRPFLAVNCAALAETLLESELFGHARGSFTGADRDRSGIFEDAHSGTLLLDEVGDMSLAMQVRLLRTLELGEVKRVGETHVRTVNVRVIAATNANLEEMIRRGQFRQDLYYRLSGFILHIPPLRERPDDIEPLAYAFMDEAAQREGRTLRFEPGTIAALQSAPWPGNVRELRNVILRAVVLARGDMIAPEDLMFDGHAPKEPPAADSRTVDRILEALGGEALELNSRQRESVARTLAHGKLTFGEYQRLFKISKSTTARDLEGLVALRILEKHGKTRGVSYSPGPKLREVAGGL